jgi:hypothetical protein
MKVIKDEPSDSRHGSSKNKGEMKNGYALLVA